MLELTYTAHDMAPFAREPWAMWTRRGEVLPPFPWDADQRLQLRAKLDALYFHLYGVTDRDDIRYIYSTFPIVQRDEKAAYGTYRSPRPVPRVDERSRRRSPRRGDRSVSNVHKSETPVPIRSQWAVLPQRRVSL